MELKIAFRARSYFCSMVFTIWVFLQVFLVLFVGSVIQFAIVFFSFTYCHQIITDTFVLHEAKHTTKFTIHNVSFANHVVHQTFTNELLSNSKWRWHSPERKLYISIIIIEVRCFYLSSSSSSSPPFSPILAELGRPEGPPSGAPYSYRKERKPIS